MAEAQGAADRRLGWQPADRRLRWSAAVLAVGVTAAMLATLFGRPAPPQPRVERGPVRMNIVVPPRPSVALPVTPRQRDDAPGPVSAGESLGANMGRSARPGCLDSDPAGSLLSIPSVARAALSEECR